LLFKLLGNGRISSQLNVHPVATDLKILQQNIP